MCAEKKLSFEVYQWWSGLNKFLRGVILNRIKDYFQRIFSSWVERPFLHACGTHCTSRPKQLLHRVGESQEGEKYRAWIQHFKYPFFLVATLQEPVLKTFSVGPNSLSKDRIRSDLRRLKNRLLNSAFQMPFLVAMVQEPVLSFRSDLIL